jgi:hypothetical protein
LIETFPPDIKHKEKEINENRNDDNHGPIKLSIIHRYPIEIAHTRNNKKRTKRPCIIEESFSHDIEVDGKPRQAGKEEEHPNCSSLKLDEEKGTESEYFE